MIAGVDMGSGSLRIAPVSLAPPLAGKHLW